jgi:hypothetical protein
VSIVHGQAIKAVVALDKGDLFPVIIMVRYEPTETEANSISPV